MSNIDKDARWHSFEKASEVVREAQANFKSAEHNYMIALQQLRRAEAQSKTIWDAMVASAENGKVSAPSIPNGER